MQNGQTNDFLTWIAKQNVIQSDSHVLYDDMESQSYYSLPVIYQPFDPQQRSHWVDVGQTQDFLHAAKISEGKVLDLLSDDDLSKVAYLISKPLFNVYPVQK